MSVSKVTERDLPGSCLCSSFQLYTSLGSTHDTVLVCVQHQLLSPCQTPVMSSFARTTTQVLLTIKHALCAMHAQYLLCQL